MFFCQNLVSNGRLPDKIGWFQGTLKTIKFENIQSSSSSLYFMPLNVLIGQIFDVYHISVMRILTPSSLKVAIDTNIYYCGKQNIFKAETCVTEIQQTSKIWFNISMHLIFVYV
jgi:hypothetical protein